MKIVAFGHRQKVGKSTATRFLKSEMRIQNRGYNIIEAGFADKVKDIAYQLYAWAGIQPAHYYETESGYALKNVVLPKIGKSPRQLWIGIGNGVRQATGYDGTWLDYLVQNVKADMLIISDLRFPAEADGLLALGAKVFKIDRPDQPKQTDGADDPLENYDKWTQIITNDGTLNEFHRKILKLIGDHLK